MASFCSLLSGITVTQVSGSDKHFTVNVEGLSISSQYTVETNPSISPINIATSTTRIQNGTNTFSFTKSAKDIATTIKLNIKITSSGATVNSSILSWSQFKGFSTSTLSSITPDSVTPSQMITTLSNVFIQPITFTISSITNETIRVDGSGTPETMLTSIDTASRTKTPTTVNPTFTFDTTIPTQTTRKGARYLLMGSITFNGNLSYILAEPFVFTTTFTYEQVTFFDKLFANIFAAGIVIIDGGSAGV